MRAVKGRSLIRSCLCVAIRRQHGRVSRPFPGLLMQRNSVHDPDEVGRWFLHDVKPTCSERVDNLLLRFFAMFRKL